MKFCTNVMHYLNYSLNCLIHKYNKIHKLMCDVHCAVVRLMLMDNGSNLKFVNFLLKASIATNRKMNPASHKISERKRDILRLPVSSHYRCFPLVIYKMHRQSRYFQELLTGSI